MPIFLMRYNIFSRCFRSSYRFKEIHSSELSNVFLNVYILFALCLHPSYEHLRLIGNWPISSHFLSIPDYSLN